MSTIFAAAAEPTVLSLNIVEFFLLFILIFTANMLWTFARGAHGFKLYFKAMNELGHARARITELTEHGIHKQEQFEARMMDMKANFMSQLKASQNETAQLRRDVIRRTVEDPNPGTLEAPAPLQVVPRAPSPPPPPAQSEVSITAPQLPPPPVMSAPDLEAPPLLDPEAVGELAPSETDLDMALPDDFAPFLQSPEYNSDSDVSVVRHVSSSVV